MAIDDSMPGSEDVLFGPLSSSGAADAATDAAIARMKARGVTPDVTIETGGRVQQKAQAMPALGGARNLPPGGGGPDAGNLDAPSFKVPTWAYWAGGGLLALVALAAALRR